MGDSMFKLSRRSLDNLAGVDSRLVAIVNRAIQLTKTDFSVTEGLRTEARQRELFNAHKTKTMKSKHLVGLAVDVVPIIPDPWNTKNPDTETAWRNINAAMMAAAKELGVVIRWGGDFNGDGRTVGSDNWDSPHFEIR